MRHPTDDPIDALLSLVRWYLDAMRRHSADLCRRTTPLLTERATGLTYEEAQVCNRLDKAVFVLGTEALDLLTELREWEAGLAVAQRKQAGRLQAGYDEIVLEWRHQMEGVQHVWADGKRPQ